MIAQDLRKKSIEDLTKQLEKLQDKVAEHSREKLTNNSKNVHELRQMKRDIARVKTVINEKQGEA